MMKRSKLAWGVASILCSVAGCSPTASPNQAPADSSASGRSVSSAPTPAPVDQGPPDYLVLAPRAYLDELAPLLELRRRQGHAVQATAVEDVYQARSKGEPNAEALRDAIVELSAATSPAKLKYVVLAGDPLKGPSIIPSFFGSIGDWRPAGFEVRPHRTDHGYAVFDKLHLAVGRLPARDEAEMTAMVHKILAYEDPVAAGAWQRKVLVFGGPADFGPVADGLLESQATSLLDEYLPYSFDVGVIFAKADSPYVYRFDQLGTKIISEMNRGSLLAVYAGHGMESSFDRARYRGGRYMIGTTKEIEKLAIGSGAPIFVALTCLTGDYGRASGQRSIAETMIQNEKGPIAVFAASDISHPYVNLLYAQALLDSFILKRAATVGDGIVGAKDSMPTRSIALASLFVPGDHDKIKAEHLTMFNLFGDPATRVRLPSEVKVQAREASVAPGAKVHVTIQSSEVAEAPVELTIETERSALKPGLVPSAEIEAMPLDKAFSTMASNWDLASDKVLASAQGRLVANSSELEIQAPLAPGRYYVKALVKGQAGIGSGFATIEVR